MINIAIKKFFIWDHLKKCRKYKNMSLQLSLFVEVSRHSTPVIKDL